MGYGERDERKYHCLVKKFFIHQIPIGEWLCLEEVLNLNWGYGSVFNYSSVSNFMKCPVSSSPINDVAIQFQSSTKK